MAVVFVDDNGQPIDLLATSRPGINLTEGVGLNLGAASGANLKADSGPNLEGKPGPKLGSLYREESREHSPKESTTALRFLLQAQLPTFDDDVVDEVWASCRKRVTDVTPEEVGRLFAEKLPAIRNQKVHSPNPFLVHAVVKSCTAAAIAAMRQGREVAKDQPVSISSDDLEQLLQDPSISPANRNLIERRLRGEA